MLRVGLNAWVTKTTAAEILANPATRRRQVTMTISSNPPNALARCRPAGRKGTGVPRLEGVVSQTPQDRPIEISECRGLDPIGEHAHQQPSRKMGGSDPAQLVSPLEAKLIQVEAGKARDRGVDRLAF